LFEASNSGTLLLDEVGEVSPGMQVKLLRALQEREIRRVGENRSRRVDVRVLAATNRDLAHGVAGGAFRQDLYYRLKVVELHVPPLRERREDIPLLVWAFVRQLEKKMGKRIDSISRKSMETLQSLSWPGNVRELRNVIEHAMITTAGRTLAVTLPEAQAGATPGSLNLQELERRHILDVLEKNGWRVAAAAEILGIKRTTLQARMIKLGIKRPGS
ncbi:MAG TPA: sigma 54-interacting transcriptional regulator, partial [Thermodesulfobacteriota bacterium]|nr:sigma 54-interacting transcriptional regulator [Thermodesulfobacteriota bacterium]